MPNHFALAILATTLAISPATAQIRSAGSGTMGFGIAAGSSGTGSARIGSPGGRAAGPMRFHEGHSSERGAFILGYPYLYPDSDAGYYSPEVPQPQAIVVPAAAQPSAPAPPRESLLIEWQGDHFVRTTMSANTVSGGQIASDYSEKSVAPLPVAGRSLPQRRVAVSVPRELPPAVLVFHDGRKEEVSEYTIMNGTIYSKADYWSTGSWTRKIQIADLDVPATLKLNQDRGVKFALPASPNEVVIRP